jgi:prepilin-type N-terminal cleavage/methylation domain-containing protein
MLNVKCEIENVRKRFARESKAARSSDIINSTFHISHRGMLNLKSEIENVRMCTRPSDIINHTSHITHRLSHRLGVTLIELLIAISIIATLSALFLGASRAAMESSRASRTKMTILKLHTLLMEQWASYETRRVDLDPAIVAQVNSAFSGNPQALGNAMQDLRVLGLRELMKFEMPDRWSDIDLNYNPLGKPTGTPQQARNVSTVVLESVPTIARSYYRRYQKALNQPGNTVEKVNENQRAETLYMTIMLMTGDGEARTMFAAQDIGDVDEDGLPEFLDGWGKPIQYLRWAPGYVGKSPLMSGDPDSDHDPFDPFRRSAEGGMNQNTWPDVASYGKVSNYVRALRGAASPTNPKTSAPWVGFRLVPLIFSAGPDSESDLAVLQDFTVSDPDEGYLNPYLADADGAYFAIGGVYMDPQDNKDETIDNITNHLIDGR